MTTALYVLAAILMLGILVTVHEAGHFFAARLTGIPVKEFAIGFGPKILSWKSKKYETQFFLRLILMGGYCMFYGEDDVEEKEKDDPRALGNYPVWKRFITVLMGPAMNFFLALVVAVLVFAVVGEDVGGEYGYVKVQSVEENTPAEKAGLKKGDLLISVNGQDARGLTPEDAPGVTDDTAVLLFYLFNTYEPGGDPLVLGVQRGDETLTASLVPRYDETAGRYMIGIYVDIQYTPAYAAVSPIRAVQLGGELFREAGSVIISSLRLIFTTDLLFTPEGRDQLSGPVGIVQGIAESTRDSAEGSAAYALSTYGKLLVLISVNLGLLNLLPIPGLDGSRLVFLIIEGIRRKPVPRKVEAYIHFGGFIVLMGLMILMTFNDVLRIFE